MADARTDTAERQELVSDLKQFGAAVRLPVRLYADGALFYCDCEEPDRMLASLPVVKGHPLTPQHVKSPYAERLIYLDLDSRWSILVGPYLYSDDDAGVALMVRRGLLDIEKMADASRHYASLPRLDYGAAIAIGRLLSERYAYRRRRGEFPFARQGGVPAASPAASSGLSTPLPENYYRIQMEDRSGHFSRPSIRLEDELAAKIEAGDNEGAQTVLRRINRLERATLADHPLRSLKNSLIGSMTIFTRAAIHGGVPDNTSFTLSDAYIRQIERASVREELEGLEERAIRAFINLVNEEKKQRYSQPVLQVIRYIDLHLTGELNVTALGGVVHLHPNYLSSLFRRETGMRLGAYIRDKRLEEAAYMLKHTNNSLKEIASFFRFHSQSHFSRAFKARYGKTPSASKQD